MTPDRSDLYRAMSLTPVKDSLTALKSLWSTRVGYSDDINKLRNAVRTSPIATFQESKKRNSPQLVYLKRGTWNELKDYMSREALFMALSYEDAWDGVALVLEAIENPHIDGIRGGKSKCGYLFGRHKTWTDVAVRETYYELSDEYHGKTSSTIEETLGMEHSIERLAAITYRVAKEEFDIKTAELREEWDDEAVLEGDEADTILSRARTEVSNHLELNDDQRSALAAFIDLDATEGDGKDWFEHAAGIHNDEENAIVNALASTTNEAPAETSSKPDIIVDPNLAPAVNALLSQATSGKLTELDGLIKSNHDMGSVINTLTEEIATLKASASRVRLTPSAEPREDMHGIKTMVAWKTASDFFKDPNGKRNKALAFEVPHFIHEKDGKEVVHPDVPLVDENYRFRRKVLVKLLTGIALGKNTWLHGHTGTGKSTLVQQVCARLGMICHRVNLDSGLERSDLTGNTELREHKGATVSEFLEGIIPQAMQQPCVLLLDEIDFAKTDVLYVIQAALENAGLRLTEDNGRMVYPNQHFRFIATGNTKGQGDEYGIYMGARVLSGATLDRFQSFIHVPYMDNDDEQAVLESVVPSISSDLAGKMVQFASEVRRAFMNGEIGTPLSPRGLHTLAELYAFYQPTSRTDKAALDQALEQVMLDKVTDDGQQCIRNLIDTTISL